VAPALLKPRKRLRVFVFIKPKWEQAFPGMFEIS
jgi:hypothetical protein